MRHEHPSRSTGEKTAVIVGAGFAGFNTAKRLANRRGLQVILIDRRNHHLFQPLLYQVATAGLNPSDIAVPIRAQFRHASNLDIHLGRIDGVDLEFEVGRRSALMTFVIVGAGPTGVELAGAIADISRTVLNRDFRHIDTTHARVILLEAGPRVLSSFSEPLSARARKDLEQLGVEVRTGATVEAIDEDGVTVGGERLAARTVFWAAGVQAVRLDLRPAPAIDRAGRVAVAPDLSLPGYPNVFVAGDMVSLEIAAGRPLPGVAPAAIQAAHHVAATIVADLEQRPRLPFRYVDKGQMATIGKNRAVAQTAGVSVTGRTAWLAWLFVHVAYLIGFRNRVVVLTRWIWSYLFSRREARLITEREWTLDG